MYSEADHGSNVKGWLGGFHLQATFWEPMPYSVHINSKTDKYLLNVW